jgi:photosystem II stability/assembly factor-like uncharacterized protein
MKSSRILPVIVFVLDGLFAAVNSVSAQTWTQTSAPTNLWYSVASSADGNKLVAAMGGQFWTGPIYTSTNAGTTWTLTVAPSQHWMCVASSADGNKLAAAVSEGGIYTSTDAGATWNTNNLASQNWLSIASSADGLKLAAVLSTSLVYLSTDGGATWTSNTTPVTDLRCVVSSADGTRLVASDNVGRIVSSTNSGVTWIQPASLGGNVSSLAASADGRKLLALSTLLSGMILGYSSTNSGNNWTSNGLPLANSWQTAASSADGTKLVVGSGKHGIYSSTDSGSDWHSNDIPNLVWQAVASSADGNRLVAVAWNNGIWTAQTAPVPALNLMPTNGNLKLSWVVPSTNFLLQQSFDLSSWTVVTNPPVLNLTDLQEEVVLSPTNNTGFYRFKTP